MQREYISTKGTLAKKASEEIKVSWDLYSDPAITLVISGDPIVGRALALLLRGPRYDAKFVPISSLSERGVLEDVRLLVLTPTPELGAERRETLLKSLSEVQSAAEMQILELDSFSAQAREGEVRGKGWHVLLWPSRTEELERRIEIILHTAQHRI